VKAAEGQTELTTEDPLTTEEPLLQPRLLFLPPTGRGYDKGSYSPESTVPRHEDSGYDLFGRSPVEPTHLFWYRWIAGHQVSFILWRTLGEAIGRRANDIPAQRELDVLAACVDGYSAMLLYSATVPRDHYHAHIRERMALQHPSFSGTWAPDYRPIRRLFRDGFPWLGDPSCAALAEAIALNQETHDHIAEHLVPDGRSLLQKSVGSRAARISRKKEDLYDNFFLAIRRPVSRAEVVEQLNSRIVELVADLAHNGLYPNVGGAHFPVLVGSSSDAMAGLATGVPRILRRAALLIADMRRPLEKARR
jgi:hypothetical protein